MGALRLCRVLVRDKGHSNCRRDALVSRTFTADLALMTIRALVLTLPLLATAAIGQSLYVSDELVITVRSGPATTNPILTNLRAGDRVEVLEVDQEIGYSLIRAADGMEGWVVSRYLTEQPIARDRLAAEPCWRWS